MLRLPRHTGELRDEAGTAAATAGTAAPGPVPGTGTATVPGTGTAADTGTTGTVDVPLSPAAVRALDTAADPQTLLASLLTLVLHRYGTTWPVLGEREGTLCRCAPAADPETGTLAALCGLRDADGPGSDSGPGPDSGRGPGSAAGWRPVQPPPGDAVRLVVAPPGSEPPSAPWTVTPEGPLLRIEFDTGTFEADTAERIGEHLAALVETAAERPDERSGAVDILLPQERALLLGDWNAPPSGHPDTTLHALVSEQAARTPDAVALRQGEAELTYGALEERAERVAARLAPRVPRPGALVVLSGLPGLDLYTAVLGIWKAGGGYVYLDPALPAARAETMLRLTDPAAVLATLSGHPVCGPEAVSVERLLDEGMFTEADAGTETDAEAEATAAPPRQIAGPESTAYVVFTSGSTGEPKGVVRPHRMHTSRVHLEQGMYPLGPGDRVLLKAPIGFREFVWPLATGAACVLAEPGRDRDDRYLADLIAAEAVTTVSFVPSMLRLLAAQPSFRDASALRHVFVGGEALGPDLEAELRAQGRLVHNTYTLSEADYVCHRGGPLPDVPGLRRAGTVVGRPLDMRVYLCDDAGRLVPPGVPGEIRTGGPGLADGYLGRPDLTAERFVANDVDPGGPGVLFRTGDLARFGPDGEVEYVGRADTQVKVRGQRVEPGEVERTLRAHPAVSDAAVVGVADAGQGAVLAAYVVPGGEEPTVQSLRAFVGERLPDFMVPSYTAVVPALPLLDSGKVDRAVLRTPPRDRPELDVPFTRPRTDEQRCAARLFGQVLGLDSVGLDDGFFALGGDSLRLMLLRGALESETGRELPVAKVLEASTPRGCAELLLSGGESGDAFALVGAGEGVGAGGGRGVAGDGDGNGIPERQPEQRERSGAAAGGRRGALLGRTARLRRRRGGAAANGGGAEAADGGTGGTGE
ncbi:amino acid adenylation domain-containing protein [Streptomyces sp. HNM0575]|uniref:non-ribosomal peptide synthetase n=1 Tax=Streptomyces sp. HNM0575 TaxID=2716338 RepID=UPI00145F3140|nr:non-ribosomal peptide synthetase [Streptomyces sp. HNM0575]NLU74413.1 amino acid adenylation domain-containing protein [Streptomyces sp. HNM0575]